MSGVSFTADPEKYKHKEETYLDTRRKEGRLLEDDQVKLLPAVGKNNPHRHEWSIRKRNLESFLKYWDDKGGPLKILDLGCGNGWMTHHFADLAHSQVTGMDLNQLELDQAARLFQKPNLRFCYGDIFDEHVMTYDCIVLAAAFQYFPDPQPLIARLLELLDPLGEIHLLETKFYPANEVEIAKSRSKAYYEQVGKAEMADYYFHHSLESLTSLGADILYAPKAKSKPWRIGKKPSPFHWLRIKKAGALL